MYEKNVYVHKECWFEYTQVKWKQTIEVCLYLSIKEVSVLCTDKKLYVFEKDLICTKKYYVHKRMFWDLHREGGPWSIEKFERKRIWFYRLNQIDHGKKMQVWWKVLKNDFESILKCKVDLWEVLKRIGSRKLEKFTFKRCFEKCSERRFRLD